MNLLEKISLRKNACTEALTRSVDYRMLYCAIFLILITSLGPSIPSASYANETSNHPPAKEDSLGALAPGATNTAVEDDTSIKSIYLKSAQGELYQKIAGTNFDLNATKSLSSNDPTYVNKRNAEQIVVTVSSSALDTTRSSSYVKAWDCTGMQVGATATFIKSEEFYTAVLMGVTGQVALEIQVKGLNTNEIHSKILAGEMDSADCKIKANGALVIDSESGPVIGYEFVNPVTNDRSTGVADRKVIRLTDDSTTVTVSARDESFQASKINVNIIKDGSHFALRTPLMWTQSNADSNLYLATLVFNEVGIYELTVSGTDALNHSITNGSAGETFVITSAAPTATVTTTESILNSVEEDQLYFTSDIAFSVTINERFLDMMHTTIGGYSLLQIEEALESSSGELGSLVFSEYRKATPSTYSLKVTYREGAYGGQNNGIPVVQAKDWYLGGTKVRDGVTVGGDPILAGKYQPFTIDKSAPVIAYIKPVTTANIDKESKNSRILFFNKTEAVAGETTTTLMFTISDNQGIASIVLAQADGTKETSYDNLIWGDATHPKQTNLQVELLEDEIFTSAETITVSDLAGNSSIWSLSEKTIDGVQTPIELVEDHTKPVLRFSNLPQQYNREDVDIQLNIIERNFSYMQRFANKVNPIKEIERTSVDGSKTDLTNLHVYQLPIGDGTGSNDAKRVGSEEDFTWQLPLHIAAREDHSNDGDYRIRACLTDLANNASEDENIFFTIDTVAPKFTVEFDTDEVPAKKTSPDGTQYYNSSRTATIRVIEHNFDADHFSISWGFTKHSSDAVEPSYTWDSITPDVHTCTVVFPSDGEYMLRVSGVDQAGNIAVYAPTGETQYTSPAFVIDTESPVIAEVYEHGKSPTSISKPTVEFPEPTGSYGNMNFYSHGIRMNARVMDRNFDPAFTTVYKHRNGVKTRQNVTWNLEEGRDANRDGYETYVTSVVYAEDGNYKTPHLDVAADYVLQKSRNNPIGFVVDLSAPTISVAVNKRPASVGDGNDIKDPIQFFNTKTKLTFAIRDNHLLDSYQLEDPEGEYVLNRTTQGVRGKASTTLVVELKDGAHAQNDTKYERNITLTVSDIAGNRRIWSISRRGKVVMDTVEMGSANTSINNEDVFPVALIQDATAPVVSLAGVTAGSYYNSSQTVSIRVNELNFGYLKRFDPSRKILHVTKRESNSGRTQSSWTVPASSFDGTHSTFTFNQAFEYDGHYELHAEFFDYANNRSNRAYIGEFTIDKTAPIIGVSWDNTDVRNGKYYKASRVATITTIEHNFDSKLMDISSNGSVSEWTSNGDIHTCTVAFSLDGTYNLTVGGRDIAGNAAVSYTEPEFIVDLTPPKVSFGGRVQRYGVNLGKTDSSGKVILDKWYDDDISSDNNAYNVQNPVETPQNCHAYNGVVMPAIEFYDQEGNGATNYDPTGVSYTLTGSKHGDRTQEFTYDVQSGSGGQTYQFTDFGLLVAAENEDECNVYDPKADDIYTLTAKMTDLAGNEAQNSIVFSVNRYGSNYIVRAYDENGSLISPLNKGENDADYDLLGAAPLIQVREINVSGFESTDDHRVFKEYANAVSAIDMVSESDPRDDGYVIAEEAREGMLADGWFEYVYTIRRGNFGIGSPSDTGDGGQGMYRIDVASVDLASNDIGTAKHLDIADYEKHANVGEDTWVTHTKAISNIAKSLKSSSIRFTLDETGPEVDVFNVPNLLAFGASCTVTLHVTDAITKGDTVEVILDGKRLKESEFIQYGAADGTGMYEFSIPASFIPFETHEVKVIVSDMVKNREPTEVQSGRFLVSTLLPECAALAILVIIIGGIIAIYRKRQDVADPEMPGAYRFTNNNDTSRIIS